MSSVNTYIVEKYQFMYQKDPHSKIFAPLAEAYRKTGETDKAIEICKKGLKFHPYFAEGYVALAKVYLDQENFEQAAKFFQKAIQLSPENLMAHRCLAQSYLKLRNPKRALKAYKMLLFLNPYDLKAKDAVRKLESLTADEYKDSSLFTLESLTGKSLQKSLELEKTSSPSSSDSRKIFRSLHRFLSLADALTVRGDFQKAEEILLEAKKALGPQDEILKRLDIMSNKDSLQWKGIQNDSHQEENVDFLFPESIERRTLKRNQKIKYLKKLLEQIKERRFQKKDF